MADSLTLAVLCAEDFTKQSQFRESGVLGLFVRFGIVFTMLPSRPKERKIAFDLAFLGTNSSSRVEYSIFKDLGAEPLARMPALLVLIASLVEVRLGAEP